jgi:general secretion pathway protein M
METPMDKLKALVAQAQAYFNQLSTRERRLVLAAAAGALCFILFITFFSFAQGAASTRRRTQEKLNKLRDAQELAATYSASEQSRQEMERQLGGSGIQLISYLEEKGAQVGVEIPTLNPKGEVPLGDGRIVESAVELTFNEINLRKLVDFLSAVEQGPGVVKVKFVRLEPRAQSQTLTAWATIATYRLK